MITSEIIKQKSQEYGADVCGIGRIYVEPDPQRDPKLILPNAKTIIGFGFAVPRGLYYTMEHQTQLYTYTSIGVKYIDEELAEIFLLKMGALIENEGYDACLQRSVPGLRVKGDKTTNPEVAETYELVYAEPARQGYPPPDIIIDCGKAAKVCGIGYTGLSGKILSPVYGPFIRYCFIVTDAVLEFDSELSEPVCDNCGKCASVCPGGAIGENGLDTWICKEFYRGNSVLPVTQYGYVPCECGKKCDIVCYKHLQEVGRI